MTCLIPRRYLGLALSAIFVLGLAFTLGAALNKTQQQKEQLIPFLRVYSAADEAGLLALKRHGHAHDGGYVVPIKAIETADLMMGYGIADDASFEEEFSTHYHKPSYGFDCGVDHINSQNKLFSFVNECIGNDSFLYRSQHSSKKITSYSEQRAALHLNGKKIFMKMDIEGAEYEALKDVLKQPSEITGLVLEIHFYNRKMIEQAIQLLSSLDQHFLLLHVHGNNYTRHYFSSKSASGQVPQVLELTYINKALVTEYHLSSNQSHPLPIDTPNNPKAKDANFTIHSLIVA
ncbi:MAG: hypothetical protein ACOYKA_02375 [Legionellaceae bacterium]